jgi:hypothetical protein
MALSVREAESNQVHQAVPALEHNLWEFENTDGMREERQWVNHSRGTENISHRAQMETINTAVEV